MRKRNTRCAAQLSHTNLCNTHLREWWTVGRVQQEYTSRRGTNRRWLARWAIDKIDVKGQVCVDPSKFKLRLYVLDYAFSFTQIYLQTYVRMAPKKKKNSFDVAN